MKIKNRNIAFNLKLILSLGTLMILAACASPRLLEKRGNVPPPVYLEGQGGTIVQPQSNEGNINFPSTINENNKISAENNSDKELATFPTKISEKSLTYKVKRGDSFWKIATMYGVSMGELAAYNNMSLKQPLHVGIILKIPPGGKLKKDYSASALSHNKEKNKIVHSRKRVLNGNRYKVKSGDSLWIIARRFRTTIPAICEANNLTKRSILKVGQILIIPKGSKRVSKNYISRKTKKALNKTKSKIDNDSANLLNSISELANKNKSSESPQNNNKAISNTNSNKNKNENGTTQPAIKYFLYPVKSGDTWETIAELYGISVKALKNANPNLASQKELKEGTEIKIPNIE